MSTYDEQQMARALALAARGQGYVEPNPLVGCVIARDHQVIAEGWHANFGGPHAEIVAIQNAGQSVRGSTMYVNLEPCCHFGKTPPCIEAIQQAGITRVVTAMRDPYPLVAGQGIAGLRQNGIAVDVGVCQSDALRLNAPFVKRVTRELPWVIAKWAMSADGRIAARDHSSRWISNADSRSWAHALRGKMDAIVVGAGTAIHDDPHLTARPAGPRTPLRLVVDRRARLPLSAQVVQTARDFPTLIAVSTDAPREKMDRLRDAGCELLNLRGPSSSEQIVELLAHLHSRQATNVLVEGGAGLLGAFFDAQCIDEVHIFIAPQLVGGTLSLGPLGGEGRAPMSASLPLQDVSICFHGTDIHLSGRLPWAGHLCGPPAGNSEPAGEKK